MTDARDDIVSCILFYCLHSHHETRKSWCIIVIKCDVSSFERLLERLLLDYLKVNTADLSGISSILFQIIYELFENFRADRNKIGAYSGNKQRDKIDRILNYIHLHYFEPLGLPEIAERFNMTETYLSRYFKEKAGQNFVNYLNDVRLKNAVADLCQTDKLLQLSVRV